MPKPSASAGPAPRPPNDFASLLATTEPVLLVGGQAVNLWALYYGKRTAELAPFVSRDVDVLGDRATLESLARLVGAKPQFFPLKPPSNEVGVVIAKDPQGLPLLIEVLRYVHGISNEELQDPVYTVAIGKTEVRLPGPIALLQAKISNVADIAQKGRQDARHVLILTRLLPAYLEDIQDAAADERISERTMIDLLERLLAVVTTAKAKKVFASMRFEPTELFATLGHKKLPKLRAFLEKRVPRSLKYHA